MIMPGVQKPHCSPWCSRNASCIGCSGAPSAARPSMVLTSCPSAITASVVQDLTALPSRCTTQAPHCEVSQPTWVPVRLRFPRRESDSSSAGDVYAFTVFPLTVISIFMRVPPVAFLDRHSGSSEQPGLVFFPPGDLHVPDGQAAAIE